MPACEPDRLRLHDSRVAESGFQCMRAGLRPDVNPDAPDSITAALVNTYTGMDLGLQNSIGRSDYPFYFRHLKLHNEFGHNLCRQVFRFPEYSRRRSVLASGARSNPSTRHKSRGNYSLRLTARTNSLIAPLVSPIGTNGSSRYWQWRSISSTPSLRYPKYSCRWYA